MNFPENLFGDAWVLGAYLPLAAVWFWCLLTAPWKRLADSSQLNVWLGTIVVLTLMWSMKAGMHPGMNMHLLGATMATLMFGRQLAIVALCIVLAAVTFNTGDGSSIGWWPYGLNALMMVIVPVFIAWQILRLVERWLPANLFIYIFFATFFGAAVNTVLTGLIATLLLALAEAYPLDMLFGDFFLSYVLLAFAEAWLTGAVITLMVVYSPDWVSTFDDSRYLKKQ